jgi:hypothetical protein
MHIATARRFGVPTLATVDRELAVVTAAPAVLLVRDPVT